MTQLESQLFLHKLLSDDKKEVLSVMLHSEANVSASMWDTNIVLSTQEFSKIACLSWSYTYKKNPNLVSHNYSTLYEVKIGGHMWNRGRMFLVDYMSKGSLPGSQQKHSSGYKTNKRLWKRLTCISKGQRTNLQL